MRWDSVKPLVKPTLNLLNGVIMPVLATVLFWTYLDRVVQILAVLVLGTIWLDKLGFNVNISKKLEKSKVWTFIKIIARSVSPVAKINEEYFEEAGTILADSTKRVVKKIEEEIQMSKLKLFKDKFYWAVAGNKKLITTYLIVVLFALDSFFGWSKKYNLPPDVWYYVGAFVVFLVLWASGGEGWTTSTFNKLRSEGLYAKKSLKAEAKKWKQKLDQVNKEIDDILAEKVDGIIPPHRKQNYEDLVRSKDLFKTKLDKILAKLDPSGELT